MSGSQSAKNYKPSWQSENEVYFFEAVIFFQILKMSGSQSAKKINLSDNYNSSRRSENEVQVLRLWFILFLSQINLTDTGENLI